MTFQELIFALERFWADRGCVIEQPYDLEVGAGTMHPATFLRALGPEPWRVGYVQPSRRPADGRYGENPYRLYRHYQYQVVLKPSPEDVQAVYLDSLRRLAIEPRDHDIRFMEDDWESPTLGASGVGWQVWLDGLEITQFTYFQQAGGIELSPVSVELTYGLERIAMALQKVDHFKDIVWTEGVTYGEMHSAAEREWSQYSYELADVQMLLKHFDSYEDEARRLVGAGNVRVAYEYTLKCSHTFNVLDARGALSVRERTGFINRVRALARKCAQTYLKQRAEIAGAADGPATPRPIPAGKS